MHNQYSGEVPFPLMGEGVTLRLRTGDVARLRSKYGPPVASKPEYDADGKRIDFFWEILIGGCLSHDPVILVDLLKAALKKNGGQTPMEANWDDLPFPFEAMSEPMMDAVMLSRWGKTVEQQAQEYREQLAAAEGAMAAATGPLVGPETDETISNESSGPDTEQESAQPSAGA